MNTDTDPQPGIVVERSNTILYCDRWAETAEFYGHTLGLRRSFENDWFVEFGIRDGVFVSVADAARATIHSGSGAGITLSWQVADVAAARRMLTGRGVVVSEIAQRWGAATVFFHDPEGNRIELWCPSR